MSPPLYTARDNGKRNNGGNTTMVTRTTMANNRIWFGDVFTGNVGNVWSVAETECVWSVEVDIFCLRHWSMEVSPYCVWNVKVDIFCLRHQSNSECVEEEMMFTNAMEGVTETECVWSIEVDIFCLRCWPIDVSPDRRLLQCCASQ